MGWNEITPELVSEIRSNAPLVNPETPADPAAAIAQAFHVTREYRALLTEIAVNAPMETAIGVLDELIREVNNTSNFCAGVFNARVKAAHGDEQDTQPQEDAEQEG